MNEDQNPVKKLTIIFKVSVLFLANSVLIYMYRKEEGAFPLLLLLAGLLIRSICYITGKKDRKIITKVYDFTMIFLGFVLVWGFMIQHLKVGDPVLYPTPMKVVRIMLDEFPRFLDNLVFSLGLLFQSFVIAFCAALPLGMLLGCKGRMRRACASYIKIMSLISPIAYLPYAIGIMPTFRGASIFVIFNAMFWSILNWTMHGVVNFDQDYTLTARLLGISKKTYILKILLPGILPDVLSGVNGCISGGFGVLVAAEMLGSSRGLGYFIKYFASFLNYHKVLVGILYLGLSVCMMTWLFDGLRKMLLSWQICERKKHYGFLGKIRKTQ